MTLLDSPVSFIATAHAKASRNFYENILGLHCQSEDPFAIVFALGSSTLRIQKVAGVPEVNYTVLGWEVVDIKKCVKELTQKGARFEKFPHLSQNDLGIWSSPSGASIAWFRDPDGNTLSLTEM